MGIRLTVAELKTFKFSGGEVYTRAFNVPNSVTMTAVLRNSDDIMQMLLTADAIKREGGTIYKLIIPYVPYARQDRLHNKGESLGIKVMAGLINSIEAREVVIYDPYSDVTPALIKNCRVYHLDELHLDHILKDKLIVCPDAGAEKRILKLKHPYINIKTIRDYETGDVLRIDLHDDDARRAYLRDVILIGNTCDTGRTFIEIAKRLKECGAKSVELYVTHGIFSKGFDVFKGTQVEGDVTTTTPLIDKVHYYHHSEENYTTLQTVEIEEMKQEATEEIIKKVDRNENS